jgi:putative transcriptional regulator
VGRTGGPVRSDTEGHGDRVRERRTALGLTQQQMANDAGVSRQTIVAMESGSYAPSVFLALAVAALLGTTVEAIWGEGEPTG